MATYYTYYDEAEYNYFGMIEKTQHSTREWDDAENYI